MWLALALIVVVSALGYLLDEFLMLQGMPHSSMLLVTNTATGIVAGALFYQMARHERAQHEMMRARMTTIADMNHHIRNALQVIKTVGAGPLPASFGDEQLQLLNASVERVEWALREVLPKYPVGTGAADAAPAARKVVPRKRRAAF